MKLALTRVDSRLVHGQVVQDWVPATGADLLIVANDEAAADPLQRMIMETCTCGDDVEVRVVPIGSVGQLLADPDTRRRSAILLVRDVPDASRLWSAGVRFERLNLGNVHAHAGSRLVSPSVCLNDEDVAALRDLLRAGVEVEIRAVSRERSRSLEEMLPAAY